MSADVNKATACPNDNEKEVISELPTHEAEDLKNDESRNKKKTTKRVCFPEEELLVSQYVEPANPWHDVPPTSRAQLAAEYLEACRKHNTPPIQSVVEQIRELPEAAIGGSTRAPKLVLSECDLLGTAPTDALEAILRKTQFNKIEIDTTLLNTEGAEALFDMIEYYESATALCLNGPRQFGIRGWQAASRLIKKSAELSEFEVSESALEPCHSPVLARALKTTTCRLRVLCLQNAELQGEPLLCLVIALKSNTSVQELRLGDNNLQPHDAMQLGNLLSINSHIHTLDLSNNQIQDKGVAHIADAIERQASHTPPSAAASPLSPHQCPLMGGYESRGLACLMLWNNQLTRNCAAYLSKAVRCSQSLCVLNIGRNAIGTETIRALSGSAALVSLGLQAARLTPEAAPTLHHLIQESKVQRLDLRDNRLGAAGLQAILTAMKDNTTLTQIDLDDPHDSSTLTEDNEVATVARLTREIRSLCRRNETATSPDRRVHRKISLTCHTTCIVRVPSAAEEERRGRLRSPLPSPAPSPAGSPVPAQQSRFSVTRVTPERELSSARSSPSTPTHSPSPSRFRVVQVSEPPKIQVQPTTDTADTPKRSSSRFSVTRNYDSIYNVSPVSTSPDTSSDSNAKTEVETNEIKQESNRTVPPESNKNVVPVIIEPTHFSNSSQNNADCGDSDNNKSDSDNNCNVTVIKSSSDLSDKKEILRDDMQLSHDEQVSVVGKDTLTKKETLLIKNSTEVSDTEKVDVNIKVEVKKDNVNNLNTVPAKVHSDQNVCIDKDYINIDKNTQSVNIQTDTKMKQIEAITEDLGNIIQEMKVLSTKTSVAKSKVKSDDFIVPVIRDSVVLKKNKSESSLDSPDLEVSRLMSKKIERSPFCDSSSSLEISGSSMESLSTIDNHQKPIIIQESIESDSELDRRKPEHMLSTESSVESSETNPVNTNFLNMSVSSNESVSPIIFSKTKKIHGSLSSLEVSVSSVDSAKHERTMVTSSDSGIEHSLQNPCDIKSNDSSNEGTLTTNSSLKEIKSCEDTLTSSPKRTSSLLDMPVLKNKGLDRMRKISWVAPSSSLQIQKPEEKIEAKLPSHLEKLLSLFQHPTSIFTRTTTLEDEKKPASSAPPKKESITSSFWTWGSTTEKEEKTDENSSSTDSTLSERIQISYVDESFSKKLDSKTPSTDTDTLSEFQSPQGNSEISDVEEKVVTEIITDDVVQKLDISDENASSNGNKPGASDSIDLIKPNDLNKNYESTCDTETVLKISSELKAEPVRTRSFAAVLKSSGSENTIEKQLSPEGQPIDKLPSKVIKGIKENISPENTLTSSTNNTKTLALELLERQIKQEPLVNAVWEVTTEATKDKTNSQFEPVSNFDKQKEPFKGDITNTQSQPTENLSKCLIQNQSSDDVFWELRHQNVIDFQNENTASTTKKDKAPLAVEEVCDDIKPVKDDISVNVVPVEDKKYESRITELTTEVGSVDLGKDALSFLAYETKDFSNQQNLAQELKEAELKMDHSPELVQDDDVANLPEVFTEVKSMAPERAKIKKSNSLEQLPQEAKKSPRVAFKESTTPRDIPESKAKLRSMSGSSPKSLPESLYKTSPISKGEHSLFKKKKKVSSLGKIARDSLLALNLSEEEIAEFKRSYMLTSVESLRSLESVSEDANSQSGNSVDSRCRCLRTSQESLMSLDSINEDCRCNDLYGGSSSTR